MFRCLLLVLTLLLLPPRASAAENAAGSSHWQWRQTATTVALIDGTRVVWQFNFDPKDAKSFFHPITAADGSELTANRPPDHPWHHGLWFSWKFINGLNYWDEDKSGESAGKTSILSTQVETHSDFSAKITMKLSYHPPGTEPLLVEDRIIEVSRPDRGGQFTIGWNATFVAGKVPVLLDRTPLPGEPNGVAHGGYAGLSLRLAPRAKTWDVRDSEGDDSESAIHGGTARYAIYGSAAGPSFWFWDDEKSNPRYPPTWYLDRKLQYIGAAFLYRGNYTVAPGKSLTFAYRMVVNPHLGPVATEGTVIKLSTVPGKMKYDLESFEVKPGSLVTIRLRNDDDMMHNLVICEGPAAIVDKLGAAVLALGESGLKENYIPKIPEIIAHTNLVEPGQGQTITFTAPTKLGDYPYFCTMPGHWIVMRGIMTVIPTAKAVSLSPAAKPVIPPDEIRITDQARVDRVPLPDVSPTALAVGLPDGLNYCFDVEQLAVRYAWTGRYLDVAPNLYRRGGDLAKPLGARFDVGSAGGPWLGSNEKPALKFEGYRIATNVTLLFTVDGTAFAQTVSAPKDGPGIVSTFEVRGASAPIHLRVAPTGLTLSTTLGLWENGLLTVPPAANSDVTRFAITLRPQR